MPTVDASNSTTLFDMTDLTLWDRSSATTVPISLLNETVFGDNGEAIQMQFVGSSLSAILTPADAYSTGTITSINNSFQRDGVFDISITGLSLDAAGLTSDPLDFWQQVLAGDTTLIAATGQNSFMFGDGRTVEIGDVLVGGDDTFVGNSTANAGFYGDVLTNSGTVVGGDDLLQNVNGSNSGFDFAGDAQINNGVLFGGDDTITLANGSGGLRVAGDVSEGTAGSTTIGGDDTI